MRRGKKAKARSGKVLPSRAAPYGFAHREDPDQGSVLVVDEARMTYVRKAFRMVAEGQTICAPSGRPSTRAACRLRVHAYDHEPSQALWSLPIAL
jgi:hypothetical protein